MNFVRKHALAYQASMAATWRPPPCVFSNADGAYGSNVNFLIDSSAGRRQDELADTYTRRASVSPIGAKGNLAQANCSARCSPRRHRLPEPGFVELGVTTIDHYFDTLGGIRRAVLRARGKTTRVHLGPDTPAEGKVRTLERTGRA
jgi:magnesium chelatase subunit H